MAGAIITDIVLAVLAAIFVIGVSLKDDSAVKKKDDEARKWPDYWW